MAKENTIISLRGHQADSNLRASVAGKDALIFEIVQGTFNTSHYLEIVNQANAGTTTTGLLGVSDIKHALWAGVAPLILGGGGFTTTTAIMWNLKLINGPTTLAQIYMHSNAYDTSKVYVCRVLVAGTNF